MSSILNARSNMFVPNLPRETFYPEVVTKWLPFIQRLKTPYETIEDFINSNIQSVTIPSITLPVVEQQQGQYTSTWRGGKELEPIVDRSINLKFRLTESYLSYWIMYDQINAYLKYVDNDPYWAPMEIVYLDNTGLGMISYKFHMITPTSLGSLDLTFAKTTVEYSTFDFSMKYNRFEIESL